MSRGLTTARYNRNNNGKIDGTGVVDVFYSFFVNTFALALFFVRLWLFLCTYCGNASCHELHFHALLALLFIYTPFDIHLSGSPFTPDQPVSQFQPSYRSYQDDSPRGRILLALVEAVFHKDGRDKQIGAKGTPTMKAATRGIPSCLLRDSLPGLAFLRLKVLNSALHYHCCSCPFTFWLASL